MEKSAVTEGYKADRVTVLRVLNEGSGDGNCLCAALQTLLLHGRGDSCTAAAEEFLQHANEEQGHADMIAERITQLNGEPNLNPDGLTARSHSQYVEGKTLLDMIQEDLVAERIAVESYSEIIRYLGNDDSTSRIMMEKILAMKEEHADDMKKLLETLSKDERFADHA